jgi:hypothetical protein
MNKFILVFVLTIFCTSAAAKESEKWNELYHCINKYVSDVAKIIPSLEEGALLLTETDQLCSTEAINLKNYLTKNRSDNLGTEDFTKRFQTYSYVVRRDVRYLIYLEKLSQE